GLIPARAVFTGTARPGVVHPEPAAIVCSVAGSACATGLLAGFHARVSAPGGHGATLANACRPNVQLPLAAPSRSQAVPSVQLVTSAGTPPHSTMQSLAAGPPPGTVGAG